jgi:thiamine phosphate synthase YjbQ (UPF0047 family)
MQSFGVTTQNRTQFIDMTSQVAAAAAALGRREGVIHLELGTRNSERGTDGGKE